MRRHEGVGMMGASRRAVAARAACAGRSTRAALASLTLLASGLGACSEVGGGPETPAAIEFTPLLAPSVAIGDTLRDINGNVAPIRAIVRNVNGDVIADAPVRYLYADANRDTALVVDSTTGIVRAVKAATSTARLAARIGDALQVIQNIIVTTRPDSVSGDTLIAALTVPARDTSLQSAGIPVTVWHKEGTAAATGVNAWLVRYEVVSPANPTNDTTAAVFVVDDNNRPSMLDTTNASGGASRAVRVRSRSYPAAARDTIVVRVQVTYRGRDVTSSPRNFRVPVLRATP